MAVLLDEGLEEDDDAPFPAPELGTGGRAEEDQPFGATDVFVAEEFIAEAILDPVPPRLIVGSFFELIDSFVAIEIVEAERLLDLDDGILPVATDDGTKPVATAEASV